ncbi:MAG: 1-deoxy-D-xylulose-5-phosphate reductoisomerase [Lachnospiraceae bacterium]|nr:1-deoxy-D-xylulose-5-phosphate reductoisomerase [Lachnospiraceae bacterium]
MKNIVLIGSTGSIGTQTLDIVRAHRDELTITALAAGRNVEKIEEQIREFSPLMACLYDESAAADLKERVRDLPVRIVCGMDGLLEEAELAESDLFLNAVVGMIGIRPTLAAIHAGKTIALANKETLVTAGHLIIPAVKEAGVQLLPVDSEHSAIFQCMNGEPKRRVKKILLTCSGGTFRGKKREELVNMTAKDALKNPNWSMGNKVTIDSASLVNKGLEVMEATWLFGVPASRIEVLVQPQSICHSAVEYVDGSIIAHLASPDMHQPIQYALFWPDRRELDIPELDLLSVGDVHFEKPDTDTFRGLPLAYRASEAGGSMPTVFNAANEEAVSLFMKDRIHFLDIYDLIEAAMDEHSVVPNPSLEEVLAVGEEARQSVRRYAEKISS